MSDQVVDQQVCECEVSEPVPEVEIREQAFEPAEVGSKRRNGAKASRKAPRTKRRSPHLRAYGGSRR